MKAITAVFFSMALTTTVAHAETVCKVMDPTGSPLNIRQSPNGKVVNKLKNGREVYITNLSYDNKNRPWAYIEGYYKGDYRYWGWAYREFLSCYER